MKRRPKLYPGHQHQWTDDLLAGPWLTCDICGLQGPRWLVMPEQARAQVHPPTNKEPT